MSYLYDRIYLRTVQKLALQNIKPNWSFWVRDRATLQKSILNVVNKKWNIPSFRLVGGFLVAQLVRIDLEPSHCPFMRAIAFSASTFFVKETKPYPFDLRVWGSRTTRQSLQRGNKTHLLKLMKKFSMKLRIAHLGTIQI